MIFESVRDALAEQFEIDPSEITMDTNLVDDIGADSLDVVELIMTLEDTYGIDLEPLKDVPVVPEVPGVNQSSARISASAA